MAEIKSKPAEIFKNDLLGQKTACGAVFSDFQLPISRAGDAS
jgi:hypothetical protein